ncbi:MAG TPA: immunoglobulin domain-containing protein [Anaerohalosphaeraceae bacterium]|nr:immunoglobulin domain-containing protein [Anaerohalosphaeraceae bacterium]HQG05655.1 immunoglobulin domain-containing protein [Anaerohalosphaeraceae bacterium]HQI07289.1 immunoglobulin domain-containing protein [Anaerohalosphaeraceae bacterium]HQJ67604.1 immunoglobulin domain-containing protein [Anaerohalosphaeraceae bacterium]
MTTTVGWMVLLLGVAAWAAIVGPYTPDAYTLHLYHFEGDGSDAVSNNPIHLTLAYGAAASASSYEGFGTALNTYEGSSNTTANQPCAYSDEVSINNLTGSDGAFTFEALIRPDVEWNAIPNHMQIVCGDNDSGQSRGWQFRVNTSGELEFIKLTGTQETFVAAIPSSGEHAWQAGQWYHAAVTYNGQENTAGNLKFYWTRLDSGAAEAALLASFQMQADLDRSVAIDFSVGNDARDMCGENFEGLVDEVRISSIARGAEEMLFTAGSPPPVIVSHPADVRVRAPAAAVFEVVFESPTPPTVIWYRSADAGEGPVDTTAPRITAQVLYDDQTQRYSALLVIEETQISDRGQYNCLVSNESGVWRLSNLASLTVEGLAARWTLDAADYTDGLYVDTETGLSAAAAGVPLFVEGADGTPAGAVQVSSTSGWAVTEPLNAALDTGAMTVSVWAKWQYSPISTADVQMDAWPEETMLAAPEGISSQGRWQHICVVYTDTTAQIYVDGLLQAEGDYALPSDTTAVLTLGSGVGGQKIFEGILDEFRIYNYAFTAEEAAQGYYEMTGEGVCLLSHTSAYDLTGPWGVPDCVVDLYDLAAFAAQWLTAYEGDDFAGFAAQWMLCTLYPNCD